MFKSNKRERILDLNANESESSSDSDQEDRSREQLKDVDVIDVVDQTKSVFEPHFGGGATFADILKYISIHFPDITKRKFWKQTVVGQLSPNYKKLKKDGEKFYFWSISKKVMKENTQTSDERSSVSEQAQPTHSVIEQTPLNSEIVPEQNEPPKRSTIKSNSLYYEEMINTELKHLDASANSPYIKKYIRFHFPEAIGQTAAMRNSDEEVRKHKDPVTDEEKAESWINMRTQVYWNGMREYYRGTVTDVKFDKRWLAKVCYDDGEVHWECLDALQPIRGSFTSQARNNKKECTKGRSDKPYAKMSDKTRNNIKKKTSGRSKLFNDQDLIILNSEYKVNPHPSDERMSELASQLSVTPYQIYIWFKNKRARSK